MPVNTNYRYVDDELVYLWDNADAVAVVFHGTFTDTIEPIRDRAAEGPDAGCGSTTAPGPCPAWARPTSPPADVGRPSASWRRAARRRRHPHDLHRRHDRDAEGRDVAPGRPVPLDVARPGRPILLQDPDDVGGYDAVLELVAAAGLAGLPACPLMHGTGWFTANIYLTQAGGSVVSRSSTGSSTSIELLDTIEREQRRQR